MTETKKKTTVDEATGIRYTESGIPLLVITYQIKKFCRQALSEETDAGVVDVAVQATKPFLNELNQLVYDVLLESLGNARKNGRARLLAEDMPKRIV